MRANLVPKWAVFALGVITLLDHGESRAQQDVGEPTTKPADIAWVTQGEFCEPETVLPLPDDTLLVSNVCGFGEANNGFLSLLNAQGEILDWRIVDGLDSPLGMSYRDNRVYVVDSNHAKVFSWPNYQFIESLPLDTKVANDIAVDANGNIYVTDSARHQVIKRSSEGLITRIAVGFRFETANGIQLFGSGLYVGGARLWRVNLQTEIVHTIGPEWMADIDGIEFEEDGTLQVTPVGGVLIRYRDADDIELLGGEGVSSANHGFSPTLNLALIPTGYDNSVIAIRVDPN